MREGLRLSGCKSLPGAELYSGDDIEAWGTDWHFHEGWQIVAVIKGERHYQFRNGSVIASPGHLVILPPRLVHRAQCNRDKQTSFRIATLPASCFTSHGAPTVTSTRQNRIVDAFVSTFGMLTVSAETGTDLSINAHLSDILATSTDGAKVDSHIIPPQVRTIKTYILAHLEELPSLAFLSLLVGMSQFYVSHMFSKYVGLSPLAFHTRARLLQARSLIAQGWTLSEASAQLNFSDQSHFGRHFKQVYDMTPGEYQQSVCTT